MDAANPGAPDEEEIVHDWRAPQTERHSCGAVPASEVSDADPGVEGSVAAHSSPRATAHTEREGERAGHTSEHSHACHNPSADKTGEHDLLVGPPAETVSTARDHAAAAGMRPPVALPRPGAAPASSAGAPPHSSSRADPIRGYIVHVSSGLFVHAEGGVAHENCRLLLNEPLRETRLLWIWHPDGSIQNAYTGSFVHPLGGFGVKDAVLISHPGGFEPRLRFKMHADGCIQHVQSGLFVHPSGGVGGMDVPLLLHPGGHEPRLQFRFLVA